MDDNETTGRHKLLNIFKEITDIKDDYSDSDVIDILTL